jgi:hypothetical protein
VESDRADDPWVLDGREQLELSLRRTRCLRTLLSARHVRGAIDPHASVRVREAGIGRLEVLVAGTLVDQLSKLEIAYLPAALGRPHAGLLERRRDPLCHRLVDPPLAESLALLGAHARECLHDPAEATALGGSVVRVIDVEPVHAVTRIRRKPTVELGAREEHEWPHKRHLLAAKRSLAHQQRLQPLRLAVGEKQRVVQRAGVHRARPGVSPGARIPLEEPRPALDLDQEDALWSDDKRIDLADRPIEQELEVRPHVVGLMIGEAPLEEGERVSLPRELGGGDLDPAAIHDAASACGSETIGEAGQHWAPIYCASGTARGQSRVPWIAAS